MTVSLSYVVRTGRFNWANESEASTNIHLSLIKDNERLVFINLSFDENDYNYWRSAFDDQPVEAVQEALRDFEKRTWFDTRREERAKFKKLFREHVNEIELNHLLKQKTTLEKKLEKTQIKLASLQKDIDRVRKYPRTDESELPFPEITEAED